MRIWRLLIVVPASIVLYVPGCATDSEPRLRQKSQNIDRGVSLLSVTNAEPGQTYEVGVYVVTKGDTVIRIAGKFQISVRDFMDINPCLDPTRLVIGQKVRVYERRKE
jgi:LysM repeat protein